ncbi:MAG TPA: ABC transporter ATP-binding protein [Acidobacteria bacterium]|jgi:iron complex transport system ATP-binding protein|nr:ABC transporter ATP-binding protein [Acidobacteriota bacterium]HIN70703.1 ABC transporter ATP-binding protein [Acidobacteriota bacterium]
MTATLELQGVTVRRDNRLILKRIDWTVAPDERWIVLGPNGSGKTTLCQVVSLYQHPTSGTVRVLGETFGRTDVRQLRKRIGYMSVQLTGMLRPGLTATDAVVTAKHAALATCWHVYSQDDYAKARQLLSRFNCDDLADRRFITLASGEQKKVEIARALMADPGLLVLDEPAAGLDLGGREMLVATLASLAKDHGTPPIVLVTHHINEIPPGFTHVLLLSGGQRLAAGRLTETLNDDALSRCFGLELRVEMRGDRWHIWTG